MLSEFLQNVQGINDGEDFPREFVDGIIEYLLVQQIITIVQKQEIEEEQQMYVQELIQYIQGRADLAVELVKEGKKCLKSQLLYLLHGCKLLVLIEPGQVLRAKWLTLISLAQVKLELKSGAKLNVRSADKMRHFQAIQSNSTGNGFTVKKMETIKFRLKNAADLPLIQAQISG